MAKRPAWSVQDDVVICENFDFMWSGGFSITQKQKNIKRYLDKNTVDKFVFIQICLLFILIIYYLFFQDINHD